MQPIDSGILPKHNDKANRVNSARQFTIAATPGMWLSRFTRRWSIHQKIRYGYILSISIAVLGTGVGLIVGEYCDDKALEQLHIAQEKHELIAELEKAVLKVQFHQQRTLSQIESNTLKQDEITKLSNSIAIARKYLSKLKSDSDDSNSLSADYTADLNRFLQRLNTELDSHNKVVQALSQKVLLDQPLSAEIETSKQVLLKTLKFELTPKFEQLAEDLEKWLKSTIAQEKDAATKLKVTQILRIAIIIAGMVLSMALAATLALYTSRAIARPIKAVTEVAKRAAQERNYGLQAPVTTEDEIGVLATSLNQLIQRVAAQIRELQQAQAQLIQSEKMFSLGQMVAGIAHEINNPVNFIYGNLNHAHHYTQDLLDLMQLYQQHYPQPVPEIQEKIEDIELNFLLEDFPKIISSMHMGAERIQQIIVSLRNFSRLDEAETKKVDIHEGIENTLLILNHRTRQGIEVIKQYQPLPLIDCYPAQLNQVFMNLLSNAIDGVLDRKELPHPQLVIQTKLIESDQIQVRIRDNGPGIAPEIKDKIFDPFFTTKPVGKGTGMGLAICYQIVEKHHGKIQVISELGQGAEFVVTLPIK